jgi:nucleotide-binding universal stress UspA family protein
MAPGQPRRLWEGAFKQIREQFGFTTMRSRIKLANISIRKGVSERDAKPMQTLPTDSATSVNNILLATDFSSASVAAFQTALCVCTELRARLLILHVFEYANAVPPETGGQLIELERIYESAQSSLDGLLQLARRASVTCETVMASGIPSEEILETISSKKINMAILGTNALHGFERLVFGSTAEAVLRKALCPILTVGPQASDAANATQLDGPVVFATDFHLATTDAIRYAATFCRATRSPLHCLNVLPRTLEAGASSHIIPQIMTEALQHVASESGIAIDPPVCAITYGSEISNAVVEYAKQQKAKLIVLGVRQASMMASHLPAHIAYRIITEASCPVLTVAFASKPHVPLAAACL